MKITAIVTIANSHIVGYKLDETSFILLADLKDKFKNSSLRLDNARLNRFNQIVVKNEDLLPRHSANTLFDAELLMYANSTERAPAYYSQPIFLYDNNDKPIKIDSKFHYDFEEQSSNFKPFLYNNGKAITQFRFLFKNISLLTIDVSNIDTQFVTDMTGMFNYSATQTLDLSTFDTRSVTTMRLMFSQCNIEKLDLSTFNMFGVQDFSRMFASATIGELILPYINIEDLLNTKALFEYAQIGILNLSHIDLSTVYNIKSIIGILYQCQASISTIVYQNAHSEIQSLLTSDWSQLE